MKKLLFFALLFSFGCTTKRERLNNEIIKNNELQKEFQEKINTSEKLFSEYSDTGDTIKANVNLTDLVNYVKSQDSLKLLNDSLVLEIRNIKNKIPK